MHQINNEKEYVVKPCTHTALAKAYGVSRKVLYTWLHPHWQQIGRRAGYKYSLEQLFIIFDLIGWPPHPLELPIKTTCATIAHVTPTCK